jgi:hypothetical protein
MIIYMKIHEKGFSKGSGTKRISLSNSLQGRVHKGIPVQGGASLCLAWF